ADLDVRGAWVGGTVRSDVARGVLASIERDANFVFARVALVGPEDIPGENVQALIVDDQPILARDVRHWGEPLMLVAAPDARTLEEALRALRPRIEPLPAMFDMERSSQVFKSIAIDKGHVDAAFARAESG